ncbi:hypothetical protein Noda2021_11120 [Candidatus Dependentiae bacterium Noda2021]|nr:hypothetical protein Noda2021_11120 [Candidatus Dependentiae bacterium Noda2021]
MKHTNYVLLCFCLLSGFSIYAMEYSDEESEEAQHSLETIGVIDPMDNDKDRELIRIIQTMSPPQQEAFNNKDYVTIPKQQFTTFLFHIIQMQKDYYSLKVEQASTTLPPKSPLQAYK